jgi:D-glycero-alpha-D-manno-heptose 1-phosphate guanylyltransferase
LPIGRRAIVLIVESMSKEVIILAGGMGTRLQSVVKDNPKCLAQINEKPFLHYLLMQLAAVEVTTIILSVGYLADQVVDYINSIKANYNMQFVFANEVEPLGTGGAIKNALQYCKTQHVTVMNGDTIFDVDFFSLWQHHLTKRFATTIALKVMINFDRYGSVIVDDKTVAQGNINAGIYVIDKFIFMQKNLPTKFSFEKEYLEKHQPNFQKIGACLLDGYFIDIGIPEDFEIAQTTLPALQF